MNSSQVRQIILSVVLLTTACTSPPAEPIDDGKVVQDVHARREDPQVLEQALAMVSPGELAFLSDGWRDRLTDPEHLSFWQANAVAWSPEVRQARRRLESALGQERSAGFPQPLNFSERLADFDEADLSNEVVATFDLLGILGLGPAAAAQQLADARVRAAMGALEVSVWRAVFNVSRAAIRLAAVQAERRELQTHFAEAQRGAKRAQLLLESGRLGQAPISRVKSFYNQLGTRVEALKAEEAQRLADLAVASGIPLDEQNQHTVSLESIRLAVMGSASQSTRPGTTALLANHPELRQLHLEYAIAEARIRSEAAEAWPRINLGPRFDIRPDDLLTGGVLRLSLPWPGSIEGRIEAAVAQRTAARQRLEDSLVQVSSRLEAAIERSARLEQSSQNFARPAVDASSSAWRGMNARFQVDEAIWDLWTDALQMRRNAITAYYQNQRDLLLATIDRLMDQTSLGENHE